ncbi:hypothetical protein FACS1894120_4090 [Clostridia bacterium]|nr:hypothetical protein FACS1894120_4090 [Clostridia bacterium]
MKIIKHGNPNLRRFTVLFILQIVLAVIPAAVAIYFIVRYIIFGDFLSYNKPYGPFLPEQVPDAAVHNMSQGLIFIALVLFAFAGFVIISQRYNILASGFTGERYLKKLVKSVSRDGYAFMNLPVRYRSRKSEIDMLIVSRRGVTIIEVKNHGGTIIGDCRKITWVQHKVYRDGRVADTEMNNPFMQLKRQRDILKNILRVNGVSVWVDSLLLFSNPKVKLRVTGATNELYFAGGEELRHYLDGRDKSDKSNKNVLTDGVVRRIAEIIRDTCGR